MLFIIKQLNYYRTIYPLLLLCVAKLSPALSVAKPAIRCYIKSQCLFSETELQSFLILSFPRQNRAPAAVNTMRCVRGNNLRSLWSICISVVSALDFITSWFLETCSANRHVWVSISCVITPENTFFVRWLLNYMPVLILIDWYIIFCANL